VQNAENPATVTDALWRGALLLLTLVLSLDIALAQVVDPLPEDAATAVSAPSGAAAGEGGYGAITIPLPMPFQAPEGPALPVPATHLLPGGPGTPPGHVAVPPSAPSEGVLGACWTAAQLAGTAGERAIRRLKTDPAPPPDWAVRAAATALPSLPPGLQGSIRTIEPRDPEARLVALTFDLCEQARERAGYDGGVVDALRSLGVKATFFAGGQWLRSHPERAMQLMADPRFEVGNHAWTHANLRLVEGAPARDQILWTQAQYHVLRHALSERPCAQTAGPAAMAGVPEWPRVFRFPYGTCNAGALALTAQLGLPAIQWNLVTGDPDQGRSARAIAATVLSGVRRSRGSIVVAHANGRGWHTAEALPLFVPALEREGYRFVTLSELLAAGEPVAAQECYEERPGDNRRYDALFKGGGKK
jgi:peptidoglycan-N-acetylglucosamine deacetylase